MALLERENFLANLGALQRQAAAGEGRLLFLGGEAGIGKSALVREFCRGAGAKVMLGACDSLSTPRPLGPLLDMAGDGTLGLGPTDVASRPRDEVFATFLRTLNTATEVVIVVFEDVHWADEATLDLLRFIGRRIEDAKVLLIASYRDDEVGPTHPLRVLMGDLATTRSFGRMKLSRLSLEAVQRLAADSAIDPDELHRRTGGNPFYVTEVLASGESGVPARVSDAVLARASRLSSYGRAVLDVCAVLGFRFDPELVTALHAPDAATTSALEECVAAGVLAAAGRAMAFRHELGRDAILETIGFTRRRALHETVLKVLGANGSADLSALAHHAEGAIDRKAVLEFAPAAGRAAANAGAHREAAAQYARALRFADGLPLGEHAALLEAFAIESTVIGQPVDAEGARRAAIKMRTETGDLARKVVDMLRLSQNLLTQGRNAEADETAAAAVRQLENLPPGPEHAFARANRAYFLMLDRRNEEAIKEGETAIALAREFGDAVSLINAFNAVGSSRILLGDHGDGIRQLEYSARLARRLGYDNAVANAYGNLGSGLGEMYRFDVAETYLRDGSAYCRQRDLDESRIYMEAWLAITLMYRGAWDEAAGVAADVLRRAATGSVITRIMALVAIGRVRARRGDPDVWTALDPALELAEQTATLQRIGPVRAARAEALYLAGDAQGAGAEATRAFELAKKARHPWHVGELTYWRTSAATQNGLEAGERQTLAMMAEPYSLQLRGEWAAAARAWEELGCPYEAARALMASSEHEPLERARATFQRLGAGPALALVEATMRDLGHRVPRGPTPVTAANPGNLTRREAQIVKLLAEGMTNQEIADKLFRSVRTVDHHVSAILAKLEAGNRVAAIQAAKRLGLVD